MTKTCNCRLEWHGRIFAAAVLAGPMTALFAHLPASAVGHKGHPSPSPAVVRRSPARGGATGNTPALSISVDDGRRTVRSGDQVTYTIKIHNIGAASAPGLKITEILPPGLTLVSATPHASAQASQLTWHVSLPAGRTATYRVVGRVGPTPKQLLRLATVACASSRSSDKPIVCAAHSDELPAGRLAAADTGHATASVTTARHSGSLRPVVTALALVVTVAASGGLILRRRTRHSA